MPSDWQPIATAPRDGTEVDLFMPGGPRITDCWWHFDGRWVRRAPGHGMIEQINGWPTHWMAFPAPPSAA